MTASTVAATATKMPATISETEPTLPNHVSGGSWSSSFNRIAQGNTKTINEPNRPPTMENTDCTFGKNTASVAVEHTTAKFFKATFQKLPLPPPKPTTRL